MLLVLRNMAFRCEVVLQRHKLPVPMSAWISSLSPWSWIWFCPKWFIKKLRISSIYKDCNNISLRYHGKLLSILPCSYIYIPRRPISQYGQIEFVGHVRSVHQKIQLHFFHYWKSSLVIDYYVLEYLYSQWAKIEDVYWRMLQKILTNFSWPFAFYLHCFIPSHNVERIFSLPILSGYRVRRTYSIGIIFHVHNSFWFMQKIIDRVSYNWKDRA